MVNPLVSARNIALGAWQSVRQYRRQPLAPTASYRILYTHGDEVYTPPQYRSLVEREWRLWTSGATNTISDGSLSEVTKRSVPAFACISFRAGAVGSVPVKVTAEGRDLDWHPLSYFLSQAGDILESVDRAHSIWGRAFLRKLYNSAGYPTGLEWLHPERVRVIEGWDGVPIVLGYRVDNEQHSLEQVIDIPLFDTTFAGNGLAPLEVAFGDVNLNIGIVGHGGSFFFNSARPDGFLTFEHPVLPADYDKAKQDWKTAFRGTTNHFKTAVMPAGAKWTPMSEAPADLAMSELNDQSKQEVCAAFEVPPALVGLGDVSDPLSAQNIIREAKRNFVEMVAVEKARKILTALNQQWIAVDFAPRQYYCLEVDPSQLSIMNDISSEKVTTVDSMTKGGVWDYDEGRQYLGYAPRDPKQAPYIQRDPTHSLALFSGMLTTRNQSRVLVGLQPDTVDVITVGGLVYPADKLADMAIANYNKLIAPPIPSTPFGYSIQPPLLESGDVPFSRATILQERDSTPLVLAVDLADNQFVRYARRALGRSLNGGTHWILDNDWRLELAVIENWQPGDVAKLLRSLDLSTAPKVDAWANGYTRNGDSIYLALEDSDGLSRFVKSIEVECAALGLEVMPLDTIGIRLARSQDTADLPQAEQRYPLVLGNVTLYLYDVPHHRWSLRSVSPAQRKELANWRHIVDRKGREHSFNVEALSASPVADFVRWALVEDTNVEKVFQVAESMLNGTLPLLLFDDGELVMSADTSHILRALDYAFVTRSKADFRRSVRSLVRGLWQGTLSAFDFVDGMNSAIRRAFQKAFNEGVVRGGLQPEDLKDSERQVIETRINEEVSYLAPFAQAIDEGNQERGGTLETFLTRAEGWVARYDGVNELGYMTAVRDKRLKWVYDPTKEHCVTCEALNGRVYTAFNWQRSGLYPRSPHLNCTGKWCGCSWIETDEPVTKGAIPKVGLRFYAPDESDHVHSEASH